MHFSHKRQITVLLMIAVMLIATSKLAMGIADWPQWRGPNRDGLVSDALIPRKWPKELKQEWKVTVGEGHSSPVVANGRIYVFARQAEEEILLCLDSATGKEIWRSNQPVSYQMHNAARAHGKGPKSTPVLNNGNVCTLGIAGILSCHDARTGKLKWRREFSKQYPRTSPLFGTAMSPMVLNGQLIAHVGGHDKGALMAFDAETGAIKWTNEMDGPAYSSPIVANLAGTRKQGPNIVPTQVWTNKETQLYLNTPVIQGNVLFGFSARNKGQYFAIDADTGKTLWLGTGRVGENAAILNLGGKVLLMLTNDAKLVVLPSTAKDFAPVAEYTVAESPTWAHPLVIGNRIFDQR